MKKFCPRCGKNISKGTFCSDCKPVDISFKDISLKLCVSGRVYYKGKWSKFSDLKSLSERLVRDAVSEDVELVEGLPDDPLLEKPGIQRDYDFKVKYDGKEFAVPVHVDVTLSPYVSKLGSTYFEGILQIRNVKSGVKEYVANYLDKNMAKNVFVNKTVETSDGLDLYFVRKKHIGVLALKLVRNFGGIIDKNPQLFSFNKQSSKDIFRINVLVTLPLFSVGDVVLFKDNPVFITGTDKLITGFDLVKSKKVTFGLNKDNIVSFVSLVKYKTSVSAIEPDIQIIDPVNYQGVLALNPFDVSLVPGQKIKVVKHKFWFILPS